jgi:hypothetical protein
MAEKFPFPRSSGSSGSAGTQHDKCALPKAPSSGAGSSGADGLRKVPGGSEVRSSGATGGKAPTNGTAAGLPRRG